MIHPNTIGPKLINSIDRSTQLSHFGPISEQKTMYDLLDNAMATGAYGSIPDHLMSAARKNPAMDWNDPLKEVLTRRLIRIENRCYATCLMGIPLYGQIGYAFEQITSARDILREAQHEKLLLPHDGMIFLDSLLPRSTIQMMSVADIYNLTPRLFERGVRGNPARVLDATITESESAEIDAAMMIALMYWPAERAAPRLLSDRNAMGRIAKIVERHLSFERATPYIPSPVVQSRPMEPFFRATVSSSRHIIRKYVERLIDQSIGNPNAATITVLTSDIPLSNYRISIMLEATDCSQDFAMGLRLDELRDGNVSDVVDYLIQEFALCGITDCRIVYNKTSGNDAEESAPTPTSMH